MSINGNNKGNQGEREWAKVMTAHGLPARRGQQFQGGPHSPDVVHVLDPIIHFEVKRAEKRLMEDWYNQASKEGEYRMAVIAHRRNHKPWYCTLALVDLYRLAFKMDVGPAELDVLMYGEGEAIVQSFRREPTRFHVEPVRVDALQLDGRMVKVAKNTIKGQHGVLAHARLDETDMWMATLLAEDFLEIAVQFAIEYLGIPTWQGPFTDIERQVRAYWQAHPDVIRQAVPFTG